MREKKMNINCIRDNVCETRHFEKKCELVGLPLGDEGEDYNAM